MTNDDKNLEQKNGTLNQEIESCKNELEKIKNQLLYITADFQNYKKRVEKERIEWMLLSKISVIKSFLPIIDDLDRAIKSCTKEEPNEKEIKWLEGFELIYKNLNKIMTDFGVVEIDCSSQFDPEKHEALIQVENSTFPSGKIVEIFEKGYLLNDKILRHAKVSVAK